MDRMREIFPGENDDKIIRRFRAMNENGLRDLLIFHVDDQEDITSTTPIINNICASSTDTSINIAKKDFDGKF